MRTHVFRPVVLARCLGSRPLGCAALAAALLLGACGRNPTQPATADAKATPAADSHKARASQRIVSLAPSITEILFALGLGDQVVGVTRYCAYPPAAGAKPKVGGYLDPNFEAITALTPDLVVLTKQHEAAITQLQGMGLKLLVVDTSGVAGILDAIPRIGQACGKVSAAAALLADINGRIEAIRRQTTGLARPRTLIVVQRDLDSAELTHVCLAGQDGFYSALLEMAAGTNAYRSAQIKFPEVSREGIIEMNPEVIVDLVAMAAAPNLGMDRLLKPWQSLQDVAAVRTGRVHVLTQDYATVPGPRFVLLLDQMARLLHPEVKWN